MTRNTVNLMEDARQLAVRVDDVARRHPRIAEEADFADIIALSRSLFADLLNKTDDYTVYVITKDEAHGVFADADGYDLRNAPRVQRVLNKTRGPR